MSKITGIKKTPGTGVDRIEWKDAKHRVHSARATDPRPWKRSRLRTPYDCP